MKARLSLGLLSPHIQRISPSSAFSSGSGSVDLFAGLDLDGLAGLGLGAGEDEAFLLCSPLVARPERRGSSVDPRQHCSHVLSHMLSTFTSPMRG